MDLKDLPKLKFLDLSNSDLRDITADTVLLCSADCALESLELKGNDRLVLPPAQIVERGGKEILGFFKDLNRGQRTCWSQTMLVVGKEASGKSSLCQALMGRICPDMKQTKHMSTVGIKTIHWPTVVALRHHRRLAIGSRSGS